MPAPKPGVAEKPRRVKVFTVHGTFDHGAGWDNWVPEDNKSNITPAFINRLSEQLRKRGVAFDELDHTQYDWSGGNSHEERRTAAIGLKKAIEAKLSEQNSSTMTSARHACGPATARSAPAACLAPMA